MQARNEEAAMALLDEIQPSAIEAWKSRVLTSVRVRQPADAERIAELCAMAEYSGKRTSVWHEAAAFYGTTCHCRACNP